MESLGRSLLFIGVIIIVVGGTLWFIGRATGVSSLPGDLSFKKGNWSVYVPLGTSLVISIVLSIVLTLIMRIGRN